MKEVLIVSIGSFFGGGMRYWVSKMVQSCTVIAFPFGTMAVNVAGCLIIGFLSGLNWREGGWMSPSAKLLLTPGVIGGVPPPPSGSPPGKKPAPNWSCFWGNYLYQTPP